jgi:hypothetical protein
LNAVHHLFLCRVRVFLKERYCQDAGFTSNYEHV